MAQNRVSAEELHRQFPLLPVALIRQILSLGLLARLVLMSDLNGVTGRRGRDYDHPVIFGWVRRLYQALQRLGVKVVLNTARGRQSFLGSYGRKLRFPAVLGLGTWVVVPFLWLFYRTIKLRNQPQAKAIGQAIRDIMALGLPLSMDDRGPIGFNVVLNGLTGPALQQAVDRLDAVARQHNLRASFTVTLRRTGHEPGMDVMSAAAERSWKGPGVDWAYQGRRGLIAVEDTPRGLTSMMGRAAQLGLWTWGILIVSEGTAVPQEMRMPNITILTATEYQQFLQQLLALLKVLQQRGVLH